MLHVVFFCEGGLGWVGLGKSSDEAVSFVRGGGIRGHMMGVCV